MKVGVLGASGLLGSAVCRSVLRRGHSLLAYSNSKVVTISDKIKSKVLPILKDDQLTREFFDHWPDAIINCAAISSPDSVDESPDYAKSINTEGAFRLASIAAHIGARFIHVSTDMVFDGTS